MLQQILINIIPMLFTGIISYFIYRISPSMHICNEGMLMDLCCLFTRTAALDEFLMFVLRTAIVVLSAASLPGIVSNHFIINLDILFIISSMLLVLYHKMKESEHLPVKAI